MYVPFEQLPDHARIWVYQTDRTLNETEKSYLQQQLEIFVNQWTSHQQHLQASFEILYDRFVVIAVDEQMQGASGCSIDKSVKMMQQLEQDLQISFFDRTLQTFWNGKELKTISLAQVKEALQNHQLSPETIVFSPTVQQKADLKTNWQIPLKNSWLKKYLVH
ncbi:MAG: hypothetical protein NZ551_04285 [Microscillaceae bacterium]|nr:hypothetical protein [Microscillaceae bacterium]MDW8460409.1 hypothetical protein [Cytophagales bacterium]